MREDVYIFEYISQKYIQVFDTSFSGKNIQARQATRKLLPVSTPAFNIINSRLYPRANDSHPHRKSPTRCNLFGATASFP